MQLGRSEALMNVMDRFNRNIAKGAIRLFFHLLQPGLDDLDQIRFRDLIGRTDDAQFRSNRRKCRIEEKQRESASQRPHEGRSWLGGDTSEFLKCAIFGRNSATCRSYGRR